MPRIAVLVPCHKRPEYTSMCIKALEEAQQYDSTTFFLIDDGSNDTTEHILRNSTLPGKVISRSFPIGLRNTVIDFFGQVEGYDYLVKMDNDCLVPKNWLRDVIKVLETSDADILSPNVLPSNAAMVLGKEDKDGKGYRPSKIVGGLWAMKKHLIDGIHFDQFSTNGIKGAFHVLNQIIMEKEPVVGWLENVVVQDIGHWSGEHPDHIKSEEHAQYSAEIGRRIAWA